MGARLERWVGIYDLVWAGRSQWGIGDEAGVQTRMFGKLPAEGLGAPVRTWEFQLAPPPPRSRLLGWDLRGRFLTHARLESPIAATPERIAGQERLPPPLPSRSHGDLLQRGRNQRRGQGPAREK